MYGWHETGTFTFDHRRAFEYSDDSDPVPTTAKTSNVAENLLVLL